MLRSLGQMWEGDHWGGTCVPGSQVLHRWQVDPARGEQPDRWKGCIAQTHFPQGSRSFLCLDVTLVCVGSFQAQEEAGGLANTHPLGGASGQAPRSWGEASLWAFPSSELIPQAAVARPGQEVG